MPFKSEAQRKYLWANEPEIARDWTDTYGSKIHKADGGRIGFFSGTQPGHTPVLTSARPCFFILRALAAGFGGRHNIRRPIETRGAEGRLP